MLFCLFSSIFFCQNVKWWFLCAVLTKKHSLVNFVWWKLKFTIHQRLFECFAHGNDWLIIFIMDDCNEMNFYFWLLLLRHSCKMWLLFQSVLASHQMTVIDFAQTMNGLFPFLGEWLLLSHVPSKIRKINDASAILLLFQNLSV